MFYALDQIRRLAGLRETAEQIIDTDDDLLAADDARRERENRIRAAISLAFRRIGLPVDEHENVVYDEENDREASVTLDDYEYDLKHLNRLYQTGLADRYMIQAGAGVLEITFRVAAVLDGIVRDGAATR